MVGHACDGLARLADGGELEQLDQEGMSAWRWFAVEAAHAAQHAKRQMMHCSQAVGGSYTVREEEM